MPTSLFSDIEKKQMDNLPLELTEGELIQFFSLNKSDKELVSRFSEEKKLGFAILLSSIRFMGFFLSYQQIRSV